MTVDAAGLLYVAGPGGNVAVYSATATGLDQPVQLITSPVLTGPTGIAVDSAGTMYVSNEIPTEELATGAIYVFAPGSTGNAVPTRTITTPDVFIGIVVDGSGNLYATDNTFTVDSSGNASASTASIVEFAPGATGAATPTKTIYVPNGGQPIVVAAGLRLDSAGNLFTAAQTASDDSENATIVTQVVEFGPTASGAAAPSASFSSTSWT